MEKEFRDYFLGLSPLKQAGFFLWPSLGGTELSKNEIHLLEEIKPSGLIFFKRNFTSMDQASSLITQIKMRVENKKEAFFKPLILSIDEEGGRVSRLPVEGIRGKSALEFAESGDKLGLKAQVQRQCNAAKEIGLNCLLAPVADTLTEEKNTVLGDRCFGRTVDSVVEYASLVHQTISENALWSCAKHFPGHGNTLGDSHKEFATSNTSLNQLKSREWMPFRSLITQNIPFIMAAHVLLPFIDPKNPATLSEIILTKQLRGDLGFEGLVLSDDLRMNAIALHYDVNKEQESSITEDAGTSKSSTTANDSYLKLASIEALNAGCDILLSCQSIEREMIIAQSIAEKMEQDKAFQEKMVQKAWRVYGVLSGWFRPTPE